MNIYKPSIDEINSAAELLKNSQIVTNQNEFPEVFKGYFSSFGASIVQCGIMTTLIVFENEKSQATNRRWVPELIRRFLFPNDQIALSTKIENVSGEDAEAKAKAEALTKQIENATVAFKVALRMFKGVKITKEIKIEAPEGVKSLPANSCKPTMNMGYEFMHHNNNTIVNWTFKENATAIELNKKICKELKNDGFQTIVMEVQAPGLLIGLGLSHGTSDVDDFKVGMQFDYTTWLPIIPGSSVKGVNRSFFPDMNRVEIIRKKMEKQKPNTDSNAEQNVEQNVEQKAEQNVEQKAEQNEEQNAELKTEQNEELEAERLKLACLKELREIDEQGNKSNLFFPNLKVSFNGKDDDDYQALKTFWNCLFNHEDIYADALITRAALNCRIVGEDYITPHYPDLLIDPTPIKILKVLPGVQFTFCFKIKSSENDYVNTPFNKVDKLKLFASILQTVGIGAKTNVGYGQLKYVSQ